MPCENPRAIIKNINTIRFTMDMPPIYKSPPYSSSLLFCIITTKQAAALVKKLGVKKIYVNCIIELEGLHGREYLAGKAEDVDCLFGIEVDE